MTKSELVNFLLEANRAGYADENARVETMPDAGHKIIFKNNNYEFSDYWYGGDPFSGQEAVTIDGKTVWAMQYRGKVSEGFEDKSAEVFAFLKQALGHCSEEEPVRGPREFSDGDWRYENEWSHDLAEFTGSEKVYYKNQLAHTCNYMGGFVDGRLW